MKHISPRSDALHLLGFFRPLLPNNSLLLECPCGAGTSVRNVAHGFPRTTKTRRIIFLSQCAAPDEVSTGLIREYPPISAGISLETRRNHAAAFGARVLTRLDHAQGLPAVIPAPQDRPRPCRWEHLDTPGRRHGRPGGHPGVSKSAPSSSRASSRVAKMTPGKPGATFLAFLDVRNASHGVIRTRPDARRGFGGAISANSRPKSSWRRESGAMYGSRGPPLAGSRAGSLRGVWGEAPLGSG